MIPLSLDPNALLLAAFVGAIVFWLTEMKKPAERQEQLVWLGVAAAGAYALRQFEGRADTQGKQGMTLTAVTEQVRTLFEQGRKHDARLNEHDDDMSDLRAEVRSMTTSVGELVKRFDKMMDAPPTLAARKRGR